MNTQEGEKTMTCNHESIDWKSYPPQCRDCYKSFKPEIVAIKILGYDSDENEYDLSDIISDDTDSSISQDIEESRYD